MAIGKSSAKRIGIIGTGAVGTAFAVLFERAGYTLAAASDRTIEKAQNLGNLLTNFGGAYDNVTTIDSADVIFFCLPDDILTDEIKLCALAKSSFERKFFFHTSGTLSSDLFEPMRKKGAHAASFHPLQSIPANAKDFSLENFGIAIEGDKPAVDCAVGIAEKLGAKPLFIQREQKTLYHTTATLASNGLIGLSGVVEEMIEAVGLEEEGREYFYRLMEQSLRNSRTMTAPEAITGPASRGDAATLKQHLHSLRQQSPHLVPIYVVIGSHCVSLAVQSGKLPKERGEEILKLFSNELYSLTI
jgi:predicted short-subunit dehydrogenase-like oxidoreductase (DUF2520 family)